MGKIIYGEDVGATFGNRYAMTTLIKTFLFLVELLTHVLPVIGVTLTITIADVTS